jgi:hypothetical protein
LERISSVKLPPNFFFKVLVSLLSPLPRLGDDDTLLDSSFPSNDTAPLLRAPSLNWLDKPEGELPESNRNGDFGEAGLVWQ